MRADEPMKPLALPSPIVDPPTGDPSPRGLSSEEAAARLRQFGPNEFTPARRGSRFRDALRTLADPMAILLILAAAASFAIGQKRDAIVLLGALLPVLGVDVYLEARSRGVLKKLAAAVAPLSRVVRDGQPADIRTEEIVPGDVLVFREGDVIHADGVIRSSANLSVDESPLTGESEPIDKAAGAPFSAGCAVLAGHGYGEVVETGLRTRYGKIAELVADAPDSPAPLQKKTARLAAGLARVAIGVAAAVFLLTWLRGASVPRALVAAISVAMAALPEEFPLVLTIFLSLGAWRLSRQGLLIRRLASIETLGSTTVLCTDKTGTITHGRFQLDRWVPLGTDSDVRELVETAVLASEISPTDPLERAIVAAARASGSDPDLLRQAWTLVRDHDFDTRGKHMSHVWRRESSGAIRVAAKGALEGILEHCAIGAAEREAAESVHERLAAQGLRLLAVAARDSAQDPAGGRAGDESGLRLLGLVGFRDPLRAEAGDAIRDLRAAGITVKLITGDHARTAEAIASAAGIDTFAAATGAELDRLSGEDFARRAGEASLFARIRPEQKYAIVDALVRRGEVVAMIGDGINDAPALRRANIAISMVKGAEVARSCADIVPLDDNLTSIVTAVREGRRIYENLERSFLFLLAFHVPIVLLSLVVPLVGFPLLLLPVHLVWLELIVHPVSALLFESEPASDDVMSRPPRPTTAPILAREFVRRSVASGALLALAVFGLYAAYQPRGEDAARGVALAALMSGNLLLTWAERAGTRAWWKAPPPRTARFWLIALPVSLSLPLFLAIRPIAAILHVTLPNAAGWAVAVGSAVLAVGWRAGGSRSRSGRPLAR